MKWIKRLLKEKFVIKAAIFMKYICFLMMLLFVIGIVLSFIGRQTFILHIGEETYTDAIYAGGHQDDWWNYSNHRVPVVEMSDSIHIFAHDHVEAITQVGLSAMYAVNTIPAIIGFWFLSRVFRNVSKVQIFTEQNAFYLLLYGLLNVTIAVFVPFVKLGIAGLTNLVSSNTIHIATGQDSFNTLISSIAFIVAAYIIYHGVQLKDKVNHLEYDEDEDEPMD